MNSWSIKERQELHGVGFPFRTRRLAAIQLLVQDNKARMQQLLYTVLHLSLPHEYRTAVLITQASRSSVLTSRASKSCFCAVVSAEFEHLDLDMAWKKPHCVL